MIIILIYITPLYHSKRFKFVADKNHDHIALFKIATKVYQHLDCDIYLYTLVAPHLPIRVENFHL